MSGDDGPDPYGADKESGEESEGDAAYSVLISNAREGDGSTVTELVDSVSQRLWWIRLTFLAVIIGIIIRNSLNIEGIVRQYAPGNIDEILLDLIPITIPSIDIPMNQSPALDTDSISLPFITDPISVIHIVVFITALVVGDVLVSGYFSNKLQELLVMGDNGLGTEKIRGIAEPLSKYSITEIIPVTWLHDSLPNNKVVSQYVLLQERHAAIRDGIALFYASMFLYVLTAFLPGGSVIEFTAIAIQEPPTNIQFWITGAGIIPANILWIINIVGATITLAVGSAAVVLTAYGLSDYMWHETFRHENPVSIMWETVMFLLLAVFFVSGVRGLMSSGVATTKPVTVLNIPVILGYPLNVNLYIAGIAFLLLYGIVPLFAVHYTYTS